MLSLLEAVGTVEEEHNGKFKVTLGPETEVLERPRGKDIDVQMVVDLRRMLSCSRAAAVHAAVEDEARPRPWRRPMGQAPPKAPTRKRLTEGRALLLCGERYLVLRR